jgi:F-type H+-transporting ATPase subunit alpha
LLERAARLADRYVIVPANHEGVTAVAEDAVNGKVYDGPRSDQNAAIDLEAMENADQYKVVKVKGSGGSLTALPIIETLLGDVSAYVPTNVISITDGQIYLETSLFNAGIRPAINVGISVSRVGGDAQTKAIRQVAGRMRLDMAAYRDLAAFAQFGSDLDRSTQAQLNRGQRLQELLKQPQYTPLSLAQEVIVLFAGTNGYVDQVSVDRVYQWEQEMLRYMDNTYPQILEEINQKKMLSPEMLERLREALRTFNLTWRPT